ncbi:MAG TPA: Ig-like domain-containing protein [Solirubrobacterales bacterium]|nr:Ig-like domain-containing protein [Solirubrobacterales bacterium]
MKGIAAGGARLVAATIAALALLGLTAEAAFGGAVISNGTVALGVNDAGQLNFADETRFVGVTYEATGNDGTRAGCQCEGWGAGVADPAGDFSGSANNDWTLPEGENLDAVSFTSDASTATSVVTIDDKLRVTHAFAPSPATPNLYEIEVTLENIGTTSLPDVRYTRLMDWDVEPTAFSEFVTIQRGTTPAPAGNLIRSNDNGFQSSDPFADHSPLDPATENADYTDKGPDDHGALFDFSFGALAVGESKEFSIFYGAAGTESAANGAVSAAALELFSLGQPDGGEATGEPNTFIWGFKAVGGEPVIPPTLALTPETASNPVNTPHTVTAELKDNLGNPVPGSDIVFEVSGANPQPAATVTTGSDGTATHTYTGTSAGTDTIKACLDNNGNDACDTGEVTDTATKTWTGAGNAAPTADAGADQTVASGAAVSLDGTGSSDPDADPLTYSWTQTGGPAVTLTGADTATPSFTAPTGPATLTFQLEVCDDAAPPACDTDEVIVNVDPPVVEGNDYAAKVIVRNAPWASGSDTKTRGFVVKVVNLGTGPFTITEEDVFVAVDVNGVPTGSVAFVKATVGKPGKRVKFRFAWTHTGVAVGDTVDFVACVNAPTFDPNPSNDCDSHTTPALAKPVELLHGPR